MTRTERKRVRWAAEMILDVIQGGEASHLKAAYNHLAPMLAGPRVRRPPKPSKVERRERKAERIDHTETVKAQVFKRDGCCVLCEGPIHDMHHLLYGSGNRIPNERVDTCASCCRAHHDLAHDGDVQTLVRLAAWAWGLGYAQAATATERRIAKIRRVQERVRRIA